MVVSGGKMHLWKDKKKLIGRGEGRDGSDRRKEKMGGKGRGGRRKKKRRRILNGGKLISRLSRKSTGKKETSQKAKGKGEEDYPI